MPDPRPQEKSQRVRESNLQLRPSLPPIPQSLVKPSHARPKSRSDVFRAMDS